MRMSTHQLSQSVRRRTGRFAFFLIATACVAMVGVGVAMAARSNKWWWDNLAGPDSSNFVGSDQIKKYPTSASSKWHGSIRMPRRISTRSSLTT